MLPIIIGACLSCGDTTIVSGFWDIGTFRDQRHAYVKSAVTLAHTVVDQQCEFHFFCGDECSDFRSEFPKNMSVHTVPLTKSVRSIYRHLPAKQTVLSAIKAMQASQVLPDGFMVNNDADANAKYILAQDSKFDSLLRAARHARQTNIAWVDSGIFRHKGHVLKFDMCRVKYQPVQGALLAVSDFGPWAPRQNTIFLSGARREIAATVMVFNRTWFQSVFFDRYKSLRLALLNDSLVTSEQGMLTLMAQQPDNNIVMQTPSYARIAARLLCQSIRCTFGKCFNTIL